MPGGFDSGSVKGLKARGGFTVDIAWNGTGGFKEATVTCTHDTPGFRVRIKNGEVKDYLPKGGYKAGDVITITPESPSASAMK